MRLFFALWPDAPAAAALDELARALAPALDGKPVPAAKIHLTLAFLGEVAEARVPDVVAAADGVRGGEFATALDHVGSYRRAKVAWAGSDAAPPALASLQGALAEALRVRGFALEEREFNPHVTVVRRIARALPRTMLPRAIGWRAEAFCLVRSETGTGRYTTMASWDLAPG
jgi:RNA 2',3'-cyclic 3'-phosphodiesterase